MLSRWNALEQVYVRDTGDDLRIWAEVPGFDAKDLQVSLERDTLLIRGERKDAAPEGYAVQRKERSALRFSHAFKLPARVEPDKIEAKLNNGVLELRLPKASEERPRTILVKAA